MKPALLIIDVQKKFFGSNPIMSQSLNDAIVNINSAIAFFREHDLPVISVQHLDEEADLEPGKESFELPDALNVLDTDLHIHKRYMNSFNKTPLEEELYKLGVDTVVVTGFCAEYCVLTTCRGAEDIDLKSMLLRGASASGILENIRFVESICDIISLGALKKILG